MSEELTLRREGSTSRLLLSRPGRGNCLSNSLVEALHDALDQAEREGTRLLVLEGEGRNFCTGFDLSDLDETSDAELLARFVRIELLLARIWTAPYATLALAQGNTLGAGADLFVVCARRIALQGAHFGFPGAGFGLVLGSRRLAERIGSDGALELITSGATIDAQEACRLGLATEIVEDVDIDRIVSGAAASASRLDAWTYNAVHGALMNDSADLDTDLAMLVRSAARPGLRHRIADYRKRAAAARLQAGSTIPQS